MANIEIDIATATKDELRAYARDMARDMVAFIEEYDGSDMSFLETALEHWDTSARPDPVELSASLFRALVEAGCEEPASEELADLFALDFDPDLERLDEPDA